MRKISVAIITFNEEQKIERSLTSIKKIADEIVIIDSFSTDETENICSQYTDLFFSAKWKGYRKQKQLAVEHCSHDWVLSLDADEVLSKELIRELDIWKNQSDTQISGHYFPRLTFFMGRWMKHTSWYPDWQLRLFRKSRGEWAGGRVHESVKLFGDTSKFHNPIEHYSYADINEYLTQMQNFSTLAAADYFEAGEKSSPYKLILYPLVEFLKNYFLQRGFQDGFPGLVVSILSSTSVFFKFLKLWELHNLAKNDHITKKS